MSPRCGSHLRRKSRAQWLCHRLGPPCACQVIGALSDQRFSILHLLNRSRCPSPGKSWSRRDGYCCFNLLLVIRQQVNCTWILSRPRSSRARRVRGAPIVPSPARASRFLIQSFGLYLVYMRIYAASFEPRFPYRIVRPSKHSETQTWKMRRTEKSNPPCSCSTGCAYPAWLIQLMMSYWIIFLTPSRPRGSAYCQALDNLESYLLPVESKCSEG